MNNEMVHYTNYSPIIIVDSPLTSSLCLIIAHRFFFSSRYFANEYRAHVSMYVPGLK